MNLLERIANNDQRAVAECVDRYGSIVWSMTRRWIRDQAEAEDAVQDVFTALWRSASRFNADKSSEATFVRMIARRRLIDRLRSRKAELEYAGDLTDIELKDNDTSPEDVTEVSIVRRVLSELLSPQKEVLLMSVVAGLSHGNIAKQLDLPLGTVKSYINRGLQRVRQELGLAEGRSSQ